MLKVLLKLFRVSHWVKNGFILLPAFFAGDIFVLDKGISLFLAMLAFSLTSSCIYIINDIYDRKLDALHPTKKNRPIASGKIKPKTGWVISIISGLLGIVLMYIVSPLAWLLLLGYLFMNLAYSFRLKHYAIVDVVIIALGFVIRIYIGGFVSQVFISEWIIMMTFLLAISLAIAKRRDDLLKVKAKSKVRPVLGAYSVEFVNIVLIITFSITLVCYMMYSVSPDVKQRLGNENVFITSFPVFLGVLRYLQLTFVYRESGSPTKILIKDKFIHLCIVLWVMLFAGIIYY